VPFDVLSEDVPASKTIPPGAMSDYETLKLMTLLPELLQRNKYY